MKKDYWRWTEESWVNPDIQEWKNSCLTAGVDIGSTSTQAVILADKKLLAYASVRTGSSSKDSAVNAMKKVKDLTGIQTDEIAFTVGTGYGRVNVPFADKTITEITCHAKGANYMYGSSVRT
ncbi:MAG: BadF/BadG/BcrA/BcrD ATPase family protein, partial [Lachnospiraceae bacterium]|nr:BadF/BadG/BcrA/BcrD ATPase family protein [Lachnospiraceae bacterium]